MFHLPARLVINPWELPRLRFAELFQLLELMHTLHTRAASIFMSWASEPMGENSGDVDDICNAETSSLWRRCWCPLLQGEWVLTYRTSATRQAWAFPTSLPLPALGSVSLSVNYEMVIHVVSWICFASGPWSCSEINIVKELCKPAIKFDDISCRFGTTLHGCT